jgi:cytochrome c peroxidase
VEIKLPPHYPQADWPADNLPTRDGVALGRRLFHDPRLSRDGSQSCASCHNASFAFADPRPVSLGVEGQPGTRNAMPLFNLAWKPAFFWDGRAARLREGVLEPIRAAHEMNETLDRAVAKLEADSSVSAEFAKVFGSSSITAERLGLALEQFLLTLISSDSRFEKALRGAAKFTADEQRGFELFFTESDPARGVRGADCFHCHGGADFSNHGFLNNGLDDDAARKDEGRAGFTRRDSDRGTFSVPSLRNVALTAPYMHDGRFATLEGVVAHYNQGVKPSDTLDPNLAKHFASGGLGLSAEEQRALAAFLRTLTGGEQPVE